MRYSSPFIRNEEALAVILDEWEQGNLTDDERDEYEIEAFLRLGMDIANQEEIESN